ncbi:hypothetical protein FGU65_13480 [Methanoculleus sp. FWC-SCC1]|uniref:GerMN domain-containing protein n=1 Tax=Methanoculleus frigidifontis TaxID=2584085 RepID=A0ABT8MDE8_9EURY|nr:hypothetical protein [Methanoculleus sp. FWC-SCC1]MDN7025880.1 hypothetical protein [Methanoculleus sp. FWC-SCC1]
MPEEPETASSSPVPEEQTEDLSSSSGTGGPQETPPEEPQKPMAETVEPAAPAPPTTGAAKPEKKRRGLKIAVGVLVVIAVLVVAAMATLTIVTTPSNSAAAYPYTVTYDVLFPNSEVVKLGNVEILAIPQADKVTLSVNKQPTELPIGEEHEISAMHAVISTLGMQILEFDFKIDGVYRGMVGDRADFYLMVRTSTQIPSFLIDELLPRNVDARPV